MPTPLGITLAALAVSRGVEFPEESSQVYQHMLADLEPGIIAEACEALGKQIRRDYESAMPEVGKIRDAVRRIDARHAAEDRARNVLPLPDDADPRTHVSCYQCHDDPSGWRPFWCPGKRAEGGLKNAHSDLTRGCQRDQKHAPHSYVERCGCWGTNPAVNARRQAADERKARQADARDRP